MHRCGVARLFASARSSLYGLPVGYPVAVFITNASVRRTMAQCEAIVCAESGLAVFELIQSQRTSAATGHCAFDLLELDGEDLRRYRSSSAKARLAKLLGSAPSNIVFNEHYEGDDAIIYRQASSGARASSCRPCRRCPTATK